MAEIPSNNSGAGSSVINSLNAAFTQLIKDQPYYIEIFLYNQLDDDGYKPVPIPFMFVDSLSIEESLMTWVARGYIVLNSDFEILERGSLGFNPNTSTTKGVPQVPIDQVKAPYVFRTDGRNRISLRVKPLLSKEQSQYLDSDWEMSFDCVIYDVEDLPSDSNGKKYRKYYFWDERYQILKERNIEYSTLYSNPDNANKDPKSLTDKQRAYNPNMVLKDIIVTAASNPPVMQQKSQLIFQTPVGSANINVGFDEITNGGSIDKPTKPIANFDDKNWDNGSNGNLILYTSPANTKAIDDLTYILDYCVSINQKGPTFLRFGRTTNDKTWKLISLESLFSTSAQNQVERLFIEDSVLPYVPYVPRAYDTPEGNSINYVSSFASRIQNYRYSPMVASDDSRITNSPIHNYNFNTNTWTITHTNNTAQSVRDNMQLTGKLGLYNFSSNNQNSNNAHILLNLNQTKTKGIMLNNVLKVSTFHPPNYTGNKMLKDALFLNESVSFDVNGLTIRTPGKFIFIDRQSSSALLNPFDDRFLGQWLVTKVNHIFTKTSYKNEIVAVKVDTFSKLWTQTENKY
jgi:hypothetical protein